MQESSIVKAWVDMVLIGPKLTWRIIKMAVASVRVIRHRSRLIRTGPKTRLERQEYSTMALEKFQGGAEAASAYSRFIGTTIFPMAKALSSETIKTINAGFSLFNKRTPGSFISGYMQFAKTTGWLFIIPVQISVFLVKLFLSSTAPLDKRVNANAKRLSKRTKYKNAN